MCTIAFVKVSTDFDYVRVIDICSQLEKSGTFPLCLPIRNEHIEQLLITALRQKQKKWKIHTLNTIIAEVSKQTTHTIDLSKCLEESNSLETNLLCLHQKAKLKPWLEANQEVSPVSLQINLDEPIVLVIGKSIPSLALVFGIISRRRVIQINNADALPKYTKELGTARSIYVWLEKSITFEKLEDLLFKLRACNETTAVGIFYPFGNELQEFLLWKQLVSMNFDTAANPYTLCFPQLPQDILVESEHARIIIGKKNDKNQVSKIIKETTSLLAFSTHSNGVDLDSSPVVLCAREGYMHNPDATKRMMPCFTNDVCIRKTANNMIVGVDQLTAELVFLAVCYGLYLNKNFYDVETSLIYQIFYRTPVVNLISTYGSPKVDTGAVLMAVDLLSRGKTIGEAVAEANAYYFARHQDEPFLFIVLGDPEYSLPKISPVIEEAIFHELPSLRIERDRVLKYYDNKSVEPSGKVVFPLIPDRLFQMLNYHLKIVSESRKNLSDDLESWRQKLADRINALATFATGFNRAVLAGTLNAEKYAVLGNELDRRILEVHDYWKNIFVEVVACRALLSVFLTTLDLCCAPEANHEESPRRCCGYCGEHTLKEENFHLIGYPHVKRHVYNCFNCGPVMDGTDAFIEAYVRCEEVVSLRQQGAMELEIKLRKPGIFRITTCVALEPEFSADSSRCSNEPQLLVSSSSSSMSYLCQVGEDKHLKLALDDFRIEPTYIQGTYLLNALILLNEDIILLRKAITISE